MKMLKSLRWLLVLVATHSVLHATAQQSIKVSVEEAVDYAMKHTMELKNLQLDYENAVNRNREITGGALPQVNGSVQLSRLFAIPVTPLPDFITPQVYGVLEKEKVKNSGTDQLITVPNQPPAIIPAQFGVPWNAQAGFTVQQLLFQPDVFVGLQARDAALEYAKNNIAVSEDKLRETVMNSYYLILVTEKQLTLVNDGIRRIEKLQNDIEQLYKNGFTEKIDIDRTRVALNNLRSTKAQLENTAQIGYALLKFNMGLSQKDTLLLTDQLNPERINLDLQDEASFNYENRSEIKLLQTAQKLQQLDVKRTKLANAPTIAMFWNYNRQALRQEFNFFKSGSAYPWFPASIAGLNMQVPIFSGLQRHYRTKQANVRLQQLNNTINLTKQGIDLQLAQSKINFKNAMLDLEAQRKNMELAKQVYELSKKKYEQGVGSSFEVLDAENAIQTAESNYFRSLYNVAIAQIAYKRALGTL
ncbi:MAG: TolC family protein [Bacteroidetes bacterium]|nr:TolC family protein [Bacteroidota bacterium]